MLVLFCTAELSAIQLHFHLKKTFLSHSSGLGFVVCFLFCLSLFPFLTFQCGLNFGQDILIGLSGEENHVEDLIIETEV